MAHQIIDIKCPNCNGTADTSQRVCKYCKQPIIVSTFNSIFAMDMSDVRGNSHAYGQAISIDPHDAAMNNVLAMYFLRLKLYDKAISAFERCMVETVDYSETFFYAALCQLRGKKAFLAAKTDIEKAEEYIAAAIVIEPKAIYHYFWAYLKYDYYERNFFNTAPTYQELLSEANGIGLSPYDVEQLYEILNVVRPKVL